MPNFINLTGKKIIVKSPTKDERDFVIPKDHKLKRKIIEGKRSILHVSFFDIYAEYISIEGLPQPIKNHYYIVPIKIARMFPERKDLITVHKIIIEDDKEVICEGFLSPNYYN